MAAKTQVDCAAAAIDHAPGLVVRALVAAPAELVGARVVAKVIARQVVLAARA